MLGGFSHLYRVRVQCVHSVCVSASERGGRESASGRERSWRSTETSRLRGVLPGPRTAGNRAPCKRRIRRHSIEGRVDGGIVFARPVFPQVPPVESQTPACERVAACTSQRLIPAALRPHLKRQTACHATCSGCWRARGVSRLPCVDVSMSECPRPISTYTYAGSPATLPRGTCTLQDSYYWILTTGF